MRKKIIGLAICIVTWSMGAAAQNTFPSSGNVGIGTTAPGALLQVGSTYSQNPSIMIGGQDSNNSSTGSYSLLFGAFRDVESIVSGIVATPAWTCCGGYPASGYPGIRLNTLGFYPVYDPANPAAYSPSMLINVNGNVGVGTMNPLAKLQVAGNVMVGNIAPDCNSPSGLQFYNGISNLLLDCNQNVYLLSGMTINNNGQLVAQTASPVGLYTQNDGFHFIADTGKTPGAPYSVTERMTIASTTGNVGIGTTSPGYKLDVAGQIHASGIVFADGSSINGLSSLCQGGDYAESVDVSGDRTKYQAGDVLVIDPNSPGKFLKSAEAYSTAVTGIYSTKPGVVGRRQTTEKNPDEVPMAMIGIVPTKVSAENGPVKPGDLLVTSSTLGYAMKGTDRSRMLGAVVGKALGGLDSGMGVIEVVVTLQ